MLVGGRASLKLEKRVQHTGFGIVLETEHDLRGTVPSRGDILRHVPGILVWVYREPTRKTKVANLELAVGVDEQVTGL